MTRLAQLLHYTSLSQALFSKPLSPIGPTQPSRGNVTRRIARWTFQDGHLVSFFFYFFIFIFLFSVCFPFILSHVVQSLLSLPRNCSYLSRCVLYLLFLFVILIIVQPLPPSLFLLQLQLVCDWILSRLLRHIGGDVCHTKGC